MIAKKKLLSMIMAVLMVIAMMPAIAWNAYADDNEVTVDGLRYRVDLNESTAIVLGFEDAYVATEINIPQYITTDGELCFVTEIGDNAFNTCPSLSSVTFGENSQLKIIGDSAFADCSQLTEIDIPPFVSSIGNNAFKSCEGLSSVTFGENSQLKNIGNSAFADCSQLTAIDIPASVSTIGQAAFASTGLHEVILPEGIEIIHAELFDSCSDLEEVTIPSTVKEIWDFAFLNCNNLTTIHFGGSRPQWEAITGNGKKALEENGLEPADYGIPEIFLDSFKITIPEGRTKAFPGDTITLSIETEVTTEHDVSQVVFNFLMADAGYPTPLNFSTSQHVRNTETNRDVWEVSEVVGNENIGVWNAAAVTAISTPNTSIYYDPNVNLWPYPAPKADLSFMQFEVIDVCNPHTSGEAVREKEVAASCDTAGSYEEVTYCTTCGKELSREAKVIPALEHDWGDWVVTTPATCTSAGEETRTCKRDPSHIDKRGTEPDPNAHDWGDWVVTTPATCTSAGEETRTCKRDPSHIDKRGTEPDPNAHDWGDWVVTTPATCTSAGEETRTCKHDPSHIDKRGTEPDPNAHDWNDGEVTKAPTCTAVGNKHFTCTLCGAEKDEAIPAAGHKWNSSLTIDKAATYAAAGSKSIHCSVCNAKKPNSAVSIPKLKVKATSLSGVTAAKKGFTAKWRKAAGVSGYQLQYALNAKFTKGKKTVKITKPGTTSKKVAKLKVKTKYYVRIRSYKTVSGKTYYSSWSKATAVTTKK